MSGATLDEARERLRWTRLRMLLFALLLVGLPLGITISLIAGRSALPATSGSQPGGTIRGRIASEDGVSTAGVPVQLEAIELGVAARVLARTTSDDEGRFVLDAPPLEGKYAVGAGGGELRRTWRELSFFDRKGLLVDPGEVVLRVEPGCALRVELLHATDRYADSGRYELRAAQLEGGFFGLRRPPVLRDGDFAGGFIELDGLPPFDGALHLYLSNGDELALELTLEPGVHVRRVEL